MTDAISASASTAAPVTAKSAPGQMDRAESGTREGKDFATTFDEVRQKNEPSRPAEPEAAANAGPEAAISGQEAAIAETGAAGAPSAGAGEVATAGTRPVSSNEELAEIDPAATDPAAAAAMAQQLMPLTPPVTAPPTPAVPSDVDPAAAVAATAAPRAAAGATAAALQAAGAGTTQIRPEVRAAVQRTGLDGAAPVGNNAAAPESGPELAGSRTSDPGSVKPGGDKPAGGSGELKLDQAAAGAGGGQPTDGTTATQDKSGASPGAEQALAAASGRERDGRAEVVRLDTRLPLHSPRFADGFSQQVVVLTHHGIQQAQMTLNPPDLGPVDVRITVNQDQATVHIAAASVAAREVIQDALPKLRDLMDQSGVRLNDAGVFAQLPQREQPSAYAHRQTWMLDAPGGRRREETEIAQPVTRSRRIGLIDAYA